MRTRRKARIAGLVLVVLALGLVSCAVNPVTGRRQLSLMSEAQEIALGTESDPHIVAEYGLYDDPKVQAYVDAVGQKMAHLSHRPNLKFTFRVLDSPVINAFALPGGFVYITRGILAHMNSEAELAIVVGHEIGHVTARHGAEQYTRQQVAGIGLGIGSVLSENVARFGGAVQQALGLMFLKYGREEENQADDLGVEYALRAGYDAEVGVHFFEVLDRQSKESGSSMPEWLSTHPAPEGRIRHTHDLAVARQPEHPDATRIAEVEHKAHVDGMIFGDDPRQGFMDGNLFKHPALRFQFELPSGWQVQNTPSAVVATAPDQKAGLQMTLEKSGGVGPADYAVKVVQSVQATIAQSTSERVHGSDAYVALLNLADETGATTSVQAGFVQRDRGGPIYQIIGQASPGAFAAYRDAFLRTIRSLQTLQDAAALQIQPNRVKLETIRAPTTLSQAFDRAGALPVPVATIALVNNLEPASALKAGFQLKLVQGAYRPKSGAK